MKNHTYLEALSETILIFDGAMGTNLDKLHLTAKEYGGEELLGCNDALNLHTPSAVASVHRSFLEVGVDVIETNTFRSNSITLQEFGLADRVHEINYKAAQNARNVADEFSHAGQQRFVAGSIGPTGKILSIDEASSAAPSFQTISDVFKAQAIALLEGGVDLFLLETHQDLLEIKAAVIGLREACQECNIDIPIQAQVTMDTYHRTLFGSDIQAVAAILEPLDIDVMGLNCSTGPDEMEQPVRFLGKNVHLPISCLPNAGMPQMKNGKVIYPLEPEVFAERLASYVENYGLSVVGGCCGTTPEHLRLLVEGVHGHPAPQKEKFQAAFLSSPMSTKSIRQTPSPFIIGERLNTQGSRKFKRIILEEDFNKAEALAQKQIADGAHGLDICTALTENDLEKENMVTLIRRIHQTVDAPLVIDSTNKEVIETALQATPGRCLINSTNFENGQERPAEIFNIAKKYGAAVMVLTIDEKGMAKEVADKTAIVKRAYELAVNEKGLAPQSLVIDPLTFSLASGDVETREAAKATLETIKIIKQKYPACHTSLGISNVSFGLSHPARKVLNSIFLYHAIQAGLDMAILNAADIIPYNEIAQEMKQAAEDLIFNRRDDALEQYINIFEKADKQETHISIEPTKPTDLGKAISFRITHRQRDGLEEDLAAFIQEHGQNSSEHEAALSLLNDHLLPAMKIVGDQFSRGEIILPFVLQSSEIMRAATQTLETYMSKDAQKVRGTILLATVYGDVHDIGKNLVRTILQNNGFEVIDLGKQVPADMIVQEAIANNVNAIGLSALLVNTSQQMPLVIEKLHTRSMQIPVLIGGAAVNNSFAQKIKQINNNEAYPGGVYYCQDAFEALSVMDTVLNK